MLNFIYSDIDLNFTAHPVRGTLSKKLDEDAVKQSIINLVKTRYFERPFQPELGCGLYDFLFDNITELTSRNIERAVTQVINNYEPRVELRQVDVIPEPENNRYNIHIIFTILNREQPAELNILMERLR